MYYLYRYIDPDSDIIVKIMTLVGHPSNQEAHYQKFNRTTVNVKGRKDKSIIIKPFNVLNVPAIRPYGYYSNGNCSNTADITIRKCIAFIKMQSLHTDLSKINITTIYPELFI